MITIKFAPEHREQYHKNVTRLARNDISWTAGDHCTLENCLDLASSPEVLETMRVAISAYQDGATVIGNAAEIKRTAEYLRTVSRHLDLIAACVT